MTSTLVSFLGRTPKAQTGYRTTTYDMPDGSTQTLSYFGFALKARISPKQMVILGTNGSMWDHIIEGFDLPEELTLSLLTEFETPVQEKQVTQSMLDSLATTINQYSSCHVRLLLIPYARTEYEQLHLLDLIASHVQDDAIVHLDITHSFRHLPMLAYAALQYLQAVKPNIVLKEITYGEYDEDSKRGRCVDLTGLLHVQQWLNATTIETYAGDFTPIAELMASDETSVAPDIQKASFYINVHRSDKAKQHLKSVRTDLSERELHGAARLFQPIFLNKTDWITQKKLYQRQSAQAWHAFERKDYFRACMFAYEAYITKKVQEHPYVRPGKESDYQTRENVRKELNDDRSFKKTTEGLCYVNLRDLRNAIAHGNAASKGYVQATLSDEEVLVKELRSIFNVLIPVES